MYNYLDAMPQNEWEIFINNIIRRYMASIKIHRLSVDDLQQEAWISILRASENFDITRGNKFSTLAFIYIKRDLEKYIRKHGKYSAVQNIDEVDIPKTSNNIEYEDSIRHMMKKWDTEEKRLLKLRHVDGLSYNDIGRKENKSHTWAMNKLEKAYSKAGSILNEDDICYRM